MSVDADEIVTIIRPQGGGKSTLMKTVFGLLHPRQGSSTFDGHDISQWPAHQIVKLGMCYVPQVANVFTTLTVEENLEMGAFALVNGDMDACKQRVYDMFPKLKQRRKQLAGIDRKSTRLNSSH